MDLETLAAFRERVKAADSQDYVRDIANLLEVLVEIELDREEERIRAQIRKKAELELQSAVHIAMVEDHMRSRREGRGL